ncbi:hypothetical protein LJC56_11110 [Christensenellaceae bacterium OttesenSCG-928-K19]|nr:hypothetical protein [Christensenellaceae bacterium OttesenSCG-928-K19]
MKGKQVIKTNVTLALDDIQELMQREWNEQQRAQYRRHDMGSQKYIMHPATDHFVILIYTRKNKVGMFSWQPPGAMRVYETGRSVHHHRMKAGLVKDIVNYAAASKKEKERLGPCEQVLLGVAAELRELLNQGGYLR